MSCYVTVCIWVQEEFKHACCCCSLMPWVVPLHILHTFSPHHCDKLQRSLSSSASFRPRLRLADCWVRKRSCVPAGALYSYYTGAENGPFRSIHYCVHHAWDVPVNSSHDLKVRCVTWVVIHFCTIDLVPQQVVFETVFVRLCVLKTDRTLWLFGGTQCYVHRSVYVCLSVCCVHSSYAWT